MAKNQAILQLRYKSRWMNWCCLALALYLYGTSAHAEPVSSAIKSQVAVQKSTARSQKKIDALDDETRRLLDEYEQATSQLSDLETYNTQMERLIVDQKNEITAKEQQLKEIEVIKRQLFPFMLHMLEVLETFVELDKPFLANERQTRIAQLRKLMNRSDIALPEKYRRLMEAFRIEAEYGQNIEAYQDTIERDGEKRTVEFLRIGRIGLYYLSLDGLEAGFWDLKKRQWTLLDNSFREPLKQAIRIAEKQAPPDLVKLPLPAPEDVQ